MGAKKMRVKDFNYVTGKKYDGMMGRCYRKSDKSFSRYGGRGIKVAGDWIASIDTFRAWVALELVRIGISVNHFIDNAKQYQLDRIDNNGPYTPNNCRLVSPQVNMRNKGRVKLTVVSAEGGEYEI